MDAHTISLRLPRPVYEQYRQRAAQTRRSLEAEVLDAVTTAAPVADELPESFAQAIAELEALDDDGLWSAARHTFPAEASDRLEALHFKRQDEGLSEAEQAAASRLVEEYERNMLVRAHAARLLMERGHDVAGLVARR